MKLHEVPAQRGERPKDTSYDTPNLTTIHILLNDTARQASHMVYAKGSHKRRHVRVAAHDAWYSGAYARRHYEVVDCDGPQGTAYSFDNNGLHQLCPAVAEHIHCTAARQATEQMP